VTSVLFHRQRLQEYTFIDDELSENFGIIWKVAMWNTSGLQRFNDNIYRGMSNELGKNGTDSLP
jgi:hypothetical protein